MSPDAAGKKTDRRSMKDVLESLVAEMVEKGILWSEAHAQLEKLFLQQAIRKAGGNLSRTAQILGLHRNTVSKKARQHGIRTRR